ncbi:MAG: polysaccharide biosynthesis tyrosine autokinase [Planctomycetota bacterium]
MGLDEAFEKMYGTPDPETPPRKPVEGDDPNESLKGDPTNTTGIARSVPQAGPDETETVDLEGPEATDAETPEVVPAEELSEPVAELPDDDVVMLGDEELTGEVQSLDDATMAEMDEVAGDLDEEPAFMGADLDEQPAAEDEDDVLALARQVVEGDLEDAEQAVDDLVGGTDGTDEQAFDDLSMDEPTGPVVLHGDVEIESEPSSVSEILSFDPEAIRTVDAFPISRLHDAELSSGASEEFRVLRTNLLSLQERRGIRSLTISSCHHSEGKTTTATNLARFMAKSRDRRILLVDADIRRPKVKEVLGIKVQFGLDDVLMGRCSLDQAMVFSEADNLMVLPTRRGHSNATELLELPLMDSLIETLDKQFDFVLYDSTPIFSTADPGVLGAKTDGIVLVIKAGTTYRESIEHALHQVEQAGGVVLGVILNQLRVYLPKYLSRYHYYQDYYYTDYYHRNREKAKRA